MILDDKHKREAQRRAALARKDALKFQQEVRNHTTTAIAAGFAFILALVWKDAIMNVINSIVKGLGLSGDNLVYQLIAAAIVTVICVAGIMITSRFSKVKKK